MNIKFSRCVFFLVFLFLLVFCTDSSFANTLDLKNVFDGASESDTNLKDGTIAITQWVFWIFYLLGAIFMGVGAFKLKQGDIAGFGKNMAGGATLFFVPAIIKLFKGLGNNAIG